MGITRVADVTGLDCLGIPVVMSIRPASRGLSVQQGKGLSVAAATISGMMESVESFAGEQILPDLVWSTVKARSDTMTPLPHLLRRPLPEDAVIAWVTGTDVITRSDVLAPEDMVRFDASLPRPDSARWFWTSTNGIAAGNTREEALLHAICELVERDAHALWRRASTRHRAATRCDPRMVDDPSVGWLLDRYQEAGIAVRVWDITSDFGIPCFVCEIDDRPGSDPYLGESAGSGCHTSLPVALCRALTEAAQSRLTAIVGSRDDIVPSVYEVRDRERGMASMLAGGDASVRGRPPPHARSIDTPTIAGDLDVVLTRLRDGGVSAVVSVDLTEQALGIPCVRVVAPDLEPGFHGERAVAGPRAQRWDAAQT